ncbi:fimbrial biogenesis chaperone [Burkholderia cepacia]|uniref:fimbrial biogenesis chaperone n=1 Tax=Burkholderia cepacia TaxID=292 RepID=UPI0012974DBD|nr:fimbria/pilus periplasmic chaperone [Burkholderia cepacia]QFS37618.1 Pili and flagellar-assembly chaperone, PapD N-terminal domai [Burkholderia cepacia]
MNLKKFVIGAVAEGLLLVGLVWTIAAQASVVISGTRVVYNASDSEVTLKVSNDGKFPALTQVWLDKGDPQGDPSKLNLPFILTPPLARLDPGKSQTIRISYTGEELPQDRETLFWFNLLEVPPKPTVGAVGPNYVQLAFRSRLKFFFRPNGLKKGADDAPIMLKWQLVPQEGRSALQVSNPTPYYITIIEAHVGDSGKLVTLTDSAMVAPGERLILPLSGKAGSSAKVAFTTLNDYGGPVTYETPLK